MITETDRQEAFDAGVASAKAQLAGSNKPLLVMDEHCDDPCASANAMGWNSVCASDENNARWAAAAFAVAPQQSFVTAIPQPVPAIQTVKIEPLSAERDTPAAVAAIQFALQDDEGMTFLRLWYHGEFDIIRREWPDAPGEVFIGADPLYKPA
ncbi:TPA: hypothetical protein NIC13_005484 [Pseudomonas aeruginosa]|uniref:hypothetical protein n=1 Tax=Pseudomonas aeruginosa TaxID=287 RepID=UPI001144C9A2|nr:hypothetical protein [Pseudomonas aeruginosa]EKS3059408.1 hypothetical protein [Pseudomonas aeruginosa]HCF3300620.1 hypothetical protein [Pseudomonas aeruginosa]